MRLPALADARAWARGVERDVMALWIAARDRRTPLSAKLVAGLVAAYAFSPIDLIPDFVPVLGMLDDLLIVPLGIILAVRLIPRPLMTEFRIAAESRLERPTSRIAVTVIVGLWIAAVVLAVWLVFRRF